MKRQLRKIPNPTYLANVALHYLGRYAASEASLRRVLTNRLRRAGMDHPAFAADHETQRALRSAIETIIDGHKKSGAINDASFAETKIIGLRRQGRSRRAIEQKLGAKGVGRDTVATALANYDGDDAPEDVEIKAARAFAKRRKFGPYGAPADADRQRKQFAAMARGGFSMSVIRCVLQAELPEQNGDFCQSS